jgi:hypothetical protein
VRPRLFAACLALGAAICFVVAYVNRDSDVEGVYFNAQGEGWTSYGPIERSPRLGDSLFDPFDPWDGYLWLGAGIALVLVAVAVLVIGRFATRFARPS